MRRTRAEIDALPNDPVLRYRVRVHRVTLRHNIMTTAMMLGVPAKVVKQISAEVCPDQKALSKLKRLGIGNENNKPGN